ncbi:hypothetical protein RJG79_11515 [Mycoplasmatota bacterium WC44]
MKKSNLIKQFYSLKSALMFGPMAIILSLVMANKWNDTVRIIVFIFGVYLIINFFIKLNKYARLYDEYKGNDVIAIVTKMVNSKHYRTLHLEYEYEGNKIKNLLNLKKNSRAYNLFCNSKEIKISVVANKPNIYFVPEIIEE